MDGMQEDEGKENGGGNGWGGQRREKDSDKQGRNIIKEREWSRRVKDERNVVGKERGSRMEEEQNGAGGVSRGECRRKRTGKGGKVG